MRKKYLFIALGGFIIFLLITVNYYLNKDYQIDYIPKNNITATNSDNNDYYETLLPVAFYEYDKRMVYWGYINLDGEVAISLNYHDALNFDENYLAVVKVIKNKHDYYGLINTKNEKVLETKYQKIEYLGEGLYYYVEGSKAYLGKYETNNREFSVLKEVAYDKVGSFYEGFAYVVSDNKLGFIDIGGVEVIPLNYEYKKDFNFNFYQNYAFIYKNGKFGVIDKENNLIKAPMYDDVLNDYELEFDYTTEYYEGYELVPVKLNNKWGYISRNGQDVIQPEYVEAYPFVNNELARVKLQTDAYNFIDKNNTLLSSSNFSSAQDFYDGYAVTSLGDYKVGLIDTSGNVVVDHNYDYVGYPRYGKILTIINSKSVYYDLNNLNDKSLTISINYYLGDNMTDCEVMFATDDKRSYVILNLLGKRIYPKITAREYGQINYHGEKYIALVAYEEASNLEYFTYINEAGELLWKVYK